MFTHADVEKLQQTQHAGPDVLSLYLPVPMDPGERHGLAARTRNLMAAAGYRDGPTLIRVSPADQEAVLGAVDAHGAEWLGHTVAIFACAPLGLFEVMTLPYGFPARAVLATRPHVRPLLTALQRHPDYRVAVVDRQHSWVLSVSGDEARTVSRHLDPGVRAARYGGWHGLEAHRVQQRVIQLSRHHYREVAASLGQGASHLQGTPLVLGGHHDSVKHLLEVLPPEPRACFAGSFTADPGMVTTAGIRALAQPIIEDWTWRHEQAVVTEIVSEGPRGLAAVGLADTLAAVSEGAAASLLIAHEGLIPGYACPGCGLLTKHAQCPGCGGAAAPVPDLLEAMAARTRADAGTVTAVRDAPFTVAAKRRFP